MRFLDSPRVCYDSCPNLDPQKNLNNGEVKRNKTSRLASIPPSDDEEESFEKITNHC